MKDFKRRIFLNPKDHKTNSTKAIKIKSRLPVVIVLLQLDFKFFFTPCTRCFKINEIVF